MKILSCGTEVPSRGYYYLLDWNEVDAHKTITEQFNKFRLCDLTFDEYKQLFKVATEKEFQHINPKQS